MVVWHEYAIQEGRSKEEYSLEVINLKAAFYILFVFVKQICLQIMDEA